MGIHTEAIRERPPEYKRVYTAKLDSRASIKIEMHTVMGTRYRNGELTQPNGRWVLFDPDAIADKILDPLLVPVIQQYVDEIYRLDKEFMSGPLNLFVDQHGHVWRRDE